MYINWFNEIVLTNNEYDNKMFCIYMLGGVVGIVVGLTFGYFRGYLSGYLSGYDYRDVYYVNLIETVGKNRGFIEIGKCKYKVIKILDKKQRIN